MQLANLPLLSLDRALRSTFRPLCWQALPAQEQDCFVPRFGALVTQGNSKTYYALKAKIEKLADEYDADAAHQGRIAEIRAGLKAQFGTDFQENKLLSGNIPPALRHKVTQEDTNRALALTVIDFIQFLSNRLVPENLEDIKNVVWYATLVLSGRAMHKGSNACLKDPVFKDTYDFTSGISYIQSGIAGFEQTDDRSDQIQCSMTTRHWVFFAPNGALQILQQPTAAEVAKMIAFDSTLREAIRTTTPLPRYIPMNTFEQIRAFPPKRPTPGQGLSDDETLDLLNGRLVLNGRQVTLKDREFPSRWSDLHTLFDYVKFDVAKYLQEGVWKPVVVLDLPGRDGLSVWGEKLLTPAEDVREVVA